MRPALYNILLPVKIILVNGLFPPAYYLLMILTNSPLKLRIETGNQGSRRYGITCKSNYCAMNLP